MDRDEFDGPDGTVSAIERWEHEEVRVDCWHPARHEAKHRPHPVTGRLVCHACHPPLGRVVP